MAVTKKFAKINNELPGKIKKESFSLDYNKTNAQKQRIDKDLDAVKSAFDSISKHCKTAVANKVVGGDVGTLITGFKTKTAARAKYTQDRKANFNSRIKADLDKQKYELLEKRLEELEAKLEKLTKTMK